jgi:hypothetical protein
MAETLEELTYDSEEDGTLVRKEIDRVVLGRGGWPTVLFLFQELDRTSGTFRAPKAAVVRLKKSRGIYRKQSSFTITSGQQARQLAGVLERWSAKMDEGRVEGDGDEVEDHGVPAAED